MSTTKKDYDRYRIIDACLRKRPYWKNDELIAAMLLYDIKVGRRTIQYDIAKLKDEEGPFKAPIIFHPTLKGYYYTDSNYSIESIPLSTSDFQTLTDMLHMMKSKAAFNEFGEVVDKLIRIGKYHLQDVNKKRVIGFEKVPPYAGDKHVDLLVKYSREDQPIVIIYKKFDSDKPEQHRIHPYYVHGYDDRWYLLALNDKLNAFRNFGLERIVSIEPLDIKYKPCPLEDPADYYKDIVGITKPNAPVEDVILSFMPAVGQFPITKPIHASQEILINNKKEVRIKLRIIPNIDVASIVLSYGNQVKVLASDSLNKILDTLR